MCSHVITNSSIDGRRVLCLVDGEHYPPVTKDAMKRIEERGAEIVGAAFIGGTEKIVDAENELSGDNGWRIFRPEPSDGSVFEMIERAVDQSGDRRGFRLSAGHALHRKNGNSLKKIGL